MRICILGPLDVRDEEGRPLRLGGPRLRTLLIRLAIDAGRTVTADRLVADLWDERPPAAAGNALQALVSRLRGVGGRDLVEYAPGGYRLAIDPGEVDAVAFERLVASACSGRERAAGDAAGRAATLREALGLWRGPALADVADASFAEVTVARLEGLRLTAIEERVESDLVLGEGARLVPELEELVAAHPLRERLRGQLMRALYAAGRQSDALTVYEEARRDLADRLGVDPSPELSAAHVAILRRDPALAATVAGPPSPARERPVRRTNLPVPITSFVGRDEEIQRVGKLLAESRLVTLTGSGGAGKTRLAGEAASAQVERMPDGVWFVPLAPVRDGLDVPRAVLAAIGIPETVRVPAEAREIARPMDRLVDALENKRLLLVLDNTEHLVDAVAHLVDRLLGAAPDIRVLTTSREPLGITGETLCPVPSLPLPAKGTAAEEAMAYASVRLFADRAAAVRPGFAVDARTAGPVVDICRALDGIPLAIELAAARLRALTPGQVAERLGDRFTLLSAGSRTALPRHQTLRAIVDWSWELLNDAERTVLRRLSVFNGGATPAAVEHVCAPESVGEGGDVIDIVASLVDKSLVMATGADDVRYRLLETVRAYALERLAESGEERPVREAHAAYFLDLAERAEPELRRRDQIRWANRLTADHENCKAVLRYAIDTGDVRTALRLVGALAWFWVLRDYEVEAGSWAVQVRDVVADRPPPGLKEPYAICVLLATIAADMRNAGVPRTETMRHALRDASALVAGEVRHPVLVFVPTFSAIFEDDWTAVDRGLRATAAHPDPWTRAASAAFEGHLAINRGLDIETMDAALSRGHTGFAALGDRWGKVVCLGGLGEVALARGEAAAALAYYEEAHLHATDVINPDYGGSLGIRAGWARAMTGDVLGGRGEIERGIRVAERAGELSDVAGGYCDLGDLARREGDLVLARTMLARGLEIVEARTRRPDLMWASARIFGRLGSLAEQEGDLAASAQWYARGLTVVDECAPLPANPTLAALVEGIAALSAARGEHDRAAELLGAAHTLHGFADPLSFDVERATSAAVAALGRDRFDAAYARGRRATREEALALAQ